MRRLATAIAAIGAFGLSSVAGAQDQQGRITEWTWQATGRAEVIDGDTIRMRGVMVRLAGIDAPEMKQICTTSDGVPWGCGVAAKVHLERLIAGREVTCLGDDRDPDRYGRQIAVCYVRVVVNLNAKMVGDGLALAYRQFSDQFEYAERFARYESRGMWTGDFDFPWEWRRKRGGI